MMQDLSMHILDVCYNSVAAKAKHIYIKLTKNRDRDLLAIVILDDGFGMSEETLKKVVDPFYTTRTTRKIGLGIPLLKETCEMCNGSFKITSKVDVGTSINMRLQLSHIDLMPVGNMGQTMITLINANEEIEYELEYNIDEVGYRFNTREIKEILDDVSINDAAILLYLQDMINENIKEIERREIL